MKIIESSHILIKLIKASLRRYGSAWWSRPSCVGIDYYELGSVILILLFILYIHFILIYIIILLVYNILLIRMSVKWEYGINRSIKIIIFSLRILENSLCMSCISCFLRPFQFLPNDLWFWQTPMFTHHWKSLSILTPQTVEHINFIMI